MKKILLSVLILFLPACIKQKDESSSSLRKLGEDNLSSKNKSEDFKSKVKDFVLDNTDCLGGSLVG